MSSLNAEVKLDLTSFLVSETDEKGNIKFANEDFCKISGYSIDELVGNPHNMVRHKDMPKAAFKDLWQTVQSGNKWRGFVKNITKGGGYYWVYATVFPFESCDGSRGYISCRRMASQKEIEKYEAIYKDMRAKE